MKYPKPFMTINELVDLGLSRHILRDLALAEGYPLVIRESGTRSCTIKFDTDELQKYHKKITQMWEGSRT